MKSYKITCTANPYQAQRNARWFNSNNNITKHHNAWEAELETDLTEAEARKWLQEQLTALDKDDEYDALTAEDTSFSYDGYRFEMVEMVGADLMGALVAFDADPFIVKDMDTAEQVAKTIEDCVVYTYTEKDADFCDLCEKLELDAENFVVKAIRLYLEGGEKAVICYASDWSHKN